MSGSGIFEIIMGLIILFVFIAMALDIGTIRKTLVFFYELELKKPESWYIITCEKCSKEFKASKALKKNARCPHCRRLNELPK